MSEQEQLAVEAKRTLLEFLEGKLFPHGGVPLAIRDKILSHPLDVPLYGLNLLELKPDGGAAFFVPIRDFGGSIVRSERFLFPVVA